MVDYRIVEDIGNGQYSAHNYHKGRKYVILFTQVPYGENVQVFAFDNFKEMCKDFLKKYKDIPEKV